MCKNHYLNIPLLSSRERYVSDAEALDEESAAVLQVITETEAAIRASTDFDPHRNIDHSFAISSNLVVYWQNFGFVLDTGPSSFLLADRTEIKCRILSGEITRILPAVRSIAVDLLRRFRDVSEPLETYERDKNALAKLARDHLRNFDKYYEVSKTYDIP